MKIIKKLLAILTGVMLPAILYCTYTIIVYVVKNTPKYSGISVLVMIGIVCSFLYLPISAIEFAYRNLK